MKCAECLYWWKEDWEEHPSCHADPNFPALCEEEDPEEPELDEED